MATEIQKIVLKRGTTVKSLAYTGPLGEVVVDTDLRSLRVQDGVTAGGVLLAKDDHGHEVAGIAGLQALLDGKAPLANPVFSGVPTVPTAVAGTSTDQAASTAFVAAAVAGGTGVAAKLATPRTVALGGDVSGSAQFDGSANVTIDVTIADDSHLHAFGNLTGLPTTLAGFGIIDAQPLDSDLSAVAALSGIGVVTRTGNGTAAVRALGVNGVGLTITNADGQSGNPTIVSNATNSNTSGAVVARDANGDFAAGTITAALAGNAATATKLATTRTIGLSGDAGGSAQFDGSANATISLTLADTGVAAGDYKSVTVDSKGRVTAASNPTTLAGFGITDALLAADYNAADVLAKLKTVDGANSGLDADTIDGVESSALARITAGGLLAPVTGNLVLDCRDGAI